MITVKSDLVTTSWHARNVLQIVVGTTGMGGRKLLWGFNTTSFYRGLKRFIGGSPLNKGQLFDDIYLRPLSFMVLNFGNDSVYQTVNWRVILVHSMKVFESWRSLKWRYLKVLMRHNLGPSFVVHKILRESQIVHWSQLLGSILFLNGGPCTLESD